jgi:subtilisin family serine protease
MMLMSVSSTWAQYWYGDNETMPLLIDSSKAILKVDPGLSPTSVVESVERIVGFLDEENLIDGFVACTLSTVEGYNAFLDSLRVVSGIQLVEPFYLTQSGNPLCVGEGFCVKFREAVSYEQIDSINDLYNVVIGRVRIGQEKTFTLLNTLSTGLGVVELANIYHELAEVEYSHPDFSANIVPLAYVLYDHYHLYQPHTKKIIGSFNNASVWDFAGLTNGITVAVLDEGVEAHEDLSASRILAGYDVAGAPPDYLHDYDPSPYSIFSHGISVAGIVGASHTTDSLEGTGAIEQNYSVYDGGFEQRCFRMSHIYYYYNGIK